jgi:fimbrial chaperone protein
MFVSKCLHVVRVCSLACVSILPLAKGSEAMSVTPLTAELSASGQNNKTTLRVHNDSAAPIPVEVLSSKLTVAEDGTLTNVPVKDKFRVFPPQATIPPGASQSFRVQWLGDQNLKASESYTLSVNQLPVELDQKKNGVQVVFNFSVIVNVAPANAVPIISVIKADVAKGSSKGNEPVITLENTGNGHALLGDGSVVLTSGSWTKTFAGEEIRKLFGMGLIQPGTKRRFSLAVPLPPEVSRYDVRVDLKRPR